MEQIESLKWLYSVLFHITPKLCGVDIVFFYECLPFGNFHY